MMDRSEMISKLEALSRGEKVGFGREMIMISHGKILHDGKEISFERLLELNESLEMLILVVIYDHEGQEETDKIVKRFDKATADH